VITLQLAHLDITFLNVVWTLLRVEGFECLEHPFGYILPVFIQVFMYENRIGKIHDVQGLRNAEHNLVKS